jgi:hypothetical protein
VPAQRSTLGGGEYEAARLAVGLYPASLRFLAAQVAGIAYHDDQPRRHGLRLRATFSAAR